MKPAVLLVVLMSFPSLLITGAQEEPTDVHNTLARLTEEIDTIKKQLNNVISSSDETSSDDSATEALPAWYTDWKFYTGAGVFLSFAACSCGKAMDLSCASLGGKDGVLARSWLIVGADFWILVAFERSRIICFGVIFGIVSLFGLCCDNTGRQDDNDKNEYPINVDDKYIDIPRKVEVKEGDSASNSDTEGTSIETCLLIFGAQTMFLFYCGRHMYNLEDVYVSFGRLDHLFFWVSAIPVQLLTWENGQMGTGWTSKKETYDRLKHLLSIGFVVKGVEKDEGLAHLFGFYISMILRVFMSFLVNHIYYGCIMLTVPLLLMEVEEGLDFAKDAFAIQFITTLDDIASKTMTLVRAPEDVTSDLDQQTPLSRSVDQ